MARSCSAAAKTCFLEHQLVKPVSVALGLAVVGLACWIAAGHLQVMQNKIAAFTGGADGKGPMLGVRVVAPDELVARMFSFPVGGAVLIDHVVERSPAHRAGLRRGDGIVAVGGQPVASTSDISGYLEQLRTGDLLKLTIVRGGLVHDLLVPLGPGTGG